MTKYMLPDGFCVDARGEADSSWNGYPVPILDEGEYLRLGEHLDSISDEEPYAGTYVADGKVTPGFYCDGLQWVGEHTFDDAMNGSDCCYECDYHEDHPIHV